MYIFVCVCMWCMPLRVGVGVLFDRGLCSQFNLREGQKIGQRWKRDTIFF